MDAEEVQILGQVDQLLHTAGVLAQAQNHLPEIVALPQFHDLPGKIVQLAQSLILSEYLADGRIRAVIVGDEPFLIAPPNADAPENCLRGMGKP